MIRAVLDTNTLVSGFGWEGSLPARVVDLALAGRFTLVSSRDLLGEFDRVLRYPKLADVFEDPDRIVQLVTSVALVVSPVHPVDRLPDEADNRVLEATREARADYLVTGDHELLALGSFESARIVSPRAFLEILEEETRSD